MKLTGKKWENYSTKSIDSRMSNDYWKTNYPNKCELSTLSLGEMKEAIDRMIDSVKRNNHDIYEIPFLVKYDNKRYVTGISYTGFGDKGMSCGLEIDTWDELKFTAPDSKPEVGEYWASRGPNDFDVSGFVKSKLAGERLLRLVKYVLDKDEPKSWLDYRDYEPNWIQFKFSAEEFDVEKLDEMTRESGIITEEILRQCTVK